MELFRTHQYYILLNKDSTLWIDRTSGTLEAKPAWELANGQDIECLGVFYGLVGRVRYNKVDRFILIRDSVLVGTVPLGNEVYKIKSIVLLNPTADHSDDLGLRICSKHNYEDFLSLSVTPESTSGGNSAFARAWGNVKSATLNQLKTTNFQTNSQTRGPSLNYKENLNLSKNERRIEEEILRIFTDSDSFYYCPDNKGDITNSVPRQGGALDDRFFWNKHMLTEIIQINSQYAQAWVCPIIQGYVEIAPIHKTDLSLILISRRSRFRAGTRYKRRGLNPDGHCANYVETEQIISYKSHAVSFVQVRGSVPLFWSQPGIKYRPAPILHRNFAENQAALEKHFEEQLRLYSKVIVVNLVEQIGKECIVFNAYTQHVLALNHPALVYVCFDFHEYCRGMHFERVSLLTDKLQAESIFDDMGYSWKDKQGLICEQRAVFRVNCIDCLDRTNVVQTALARAMLIRQLKKLGIVSPEGDLPKDMNAKFQVMWANNGDTISRQYSGTAALKGDFTRTGDRKLSGLMKDGMTSANRYYLSRFKDNVRQACLDIMCGEMENTDEPISDEDDEDEEEDANSEEEEKISLQHIRTLIEDCKRLMLTDEEHVINAWPLIALEDVSSGLSGEDFDRILILTKDMLKIAEYNVHLDSMKLMLCAPLRYIQSICLGPLLKPSAGSTPVSTPSVVSKSKRLYMKLSLNSGADATRNSTSSGDATTNSTSGGDATRNFTSSGDATLVVTSSRIHYFNNQAALLRSIDEKNEALRAVAESVQICMRLCDCPVDVNYGPIDMSKSREKSSGNMVVSNVLSLIKKHRKQSDGNMMLPPPIQMEIGKEADESYIANIDINVNIDTGDELDLNDILIDENLSLDGHSNHNSTDLSLHARQAASKPSSPSSQAEARPSNTTSDFQQHIDNDVRLNKRDNEPNSHTIATKPSSLADEKIDSTLKEVKIKSEKMSSKDDLISTLNSKTDSANTKSTFNTKPHVQDNKPSSDVEYTTSNEPPSVNNKSSIIVKLNSCDLLDTPPDAAKQKPQFTLNLVSEFPAKPSSQNRSSENLSTLQNNSSKPCGQNRSSENLSTLRSNTSIQNRSNENLSTLRSTPGDESPCKITKSSSEKDLLFNSIKTSQSDNSTLRQNLRTVMVSPTNAFSKFVTKGVANLNSLDPRRRLSIQRVTSPSGGAGGVGNFAADTREALEEKWRKQGCRSKLIAL